MKLEPPQLKGRLFYFLFFTPYVYFEVHLRLKDQFFADFYDY